jgi:hypothetical protein
LPELNILKHISERYTKVEVQKKANRQGAIAKRDNKEKYEPRSSRRAQSKKQTDVGAKNFSPMFGNNAKKRSYNVGAGPCACPDS